MEPPEGLTYPELQRGARTGLVRALLGVVGAFAAAFAIAPVLVQGLFLAGLVLSGSSAADAADELADTAHATPVTLACLNVTLACAIPIAILATLLVHGRRPGWILSVVARIRWRWLLACLGLSAVTLVVTVIVSSVLPVTQTDSTGDLSGTVNDLTATTVGFMVVILLLTPLQAAGEEFLFRGYLTQAVGGLFRARWVAVVVPALVFALFHGIGQDVPIFFDRFAFGLVAGVLVIATGGLEAGIAMHVLNNFVAFGAALAYSSIGDALTTSSGSWWNIPVTLTQSLVYLALATWCARRRGLQTRTAALAGRGDFASPVRPL
ncbi:lysostaphin resistance A-like protein [Nocardioides sp. DS6]|uniref:Lysostaphin resistance A-like protein n=1 Tax=Nocardioides eburneus TaxID=3231482 RepID=A0ABV3SU89_9ACTN